MGGTPARAAMIGPMDAPAAAEPTRSDESVLHDMDPRRPWPERLRHIVQTMRDLSRQTDPEEMVDVYASRMRGSIPSERTVSLSRRGLDSPWYRITRSSTWEYHPNPWTERDKLPLLDRGFLGELLYADEPRVIEDLSFASDDPGLEYLKGMRSLLAIPHYDQGVAKNMVLFMNSRPGAFPQERMPEIVWINNLFGRATHNLVLSSDLKKAYDAVDRELHVVADIQRSLLPSELPRIPGVDLAASYRTARQAGGDYYDLLPLPGGKWGVLIADVSGHGTPAAVVMAIMHSLAHSLPGPAVRPAEMLAYLNEKLCRHYTVSSGAFVTAFYGVYDPAAHTLTYACAGHNPPRLRRLVGATCAAGSPIGSCMTGGTLFSLDRAQRLPLGVMPGEQYEDQVEEMLPGDEVIFYTDGITESRAPESPEDRGAFFGVERLDEILLTEHRTARETLDDVLRAVELFTNGAPPADDQTLVVAQFN